MVSLSKITIVTAKNACICVFLMCNRFKKLNTVRDNDIISNDNDKNLKIYPRGRIRDKNFMKFKNAYIKLYNGKSS